MSNTHIKSSTIVLTSILCLASLGDRAQARPAQRVAATPQTAGGQACIIDRFRGAAGAGHVGWAVEIAPGKYMYGSVEDPTGASGIARGKPNGGWYATGSWNDMLNAFRNPLLRVSNPAHAGERYDFIKCAAVARPNVPQAQADGRTMPGRGYDLIGNNCLDAAHAVVRDYGAPGLPNPTTALTPNRYFETLPASWRSMRL